MSLSLSRIIKSRFLKVKEKWVYQRRDICKDCPLNSKNLEKLTAKQKILNFFSKLLTKITFAESEDLGECTHEECGCDIFFKTQVKEEICHDNKWKSIYIPNTAQKQKWRK